MAPAKPYGNDCCDQGTQSLVVDESPHFVTHLHILVIIPSFSHFLTTPDETSNSECGDVNSPDCGRLDSFWSIGRAIARTSLSHACIASDSGSQTKKNRMPLTPPVVVLDAASRKRSEEAAVFSIPVRCRHLDTKHCHRCLLRIDLSILKNS